jgi:hypothetical protein
MYAKRDEAAMWDAIFVTVTLVFFVMSLAYVEACSRLE